MTEYLIDKNQIPMSVEDFYGFYIHHVDSQKVATLSIRDTHGSVPVSITIKLGPRDIPRDPNIEEVGIQDLDNQIDDGTESPEVEAFRQ